jgi:hypothetical protein
MRVREETPAPCQSHTLVVREREREREREITERREKEN